MKGNKIISRIFDLANAVEDCNKARDLCNDLVPALALWDARWQLLAIWMVSIFAAAYF